jgi:cell division inhibitor SepF
MPGAMRKMGVYLGLVEDEDYGEAEYAHAGAPGRRDEYAEARYPREHAAARQTELVHAGAREYSEDSDGYPVGYADELPAYQITTLHPRTYNEARTIGEQFRKSTPVIMNLSEMDDADAKRLVDFAAGLTFGLHGRIERVTAKVFLLSPHNVTVTAQDKARIVETGFFNQS